MFEKLTDLETLKIAQKVDKELKGYRDQAAFNVATDILLDYAQERDDLFWEANEAEAAYQAGIRAVRSFTALEILGFFADDAPIR